MRRAWIIIILMWVVFWPASLHAHADDVADDVAALDNIDHAFKSVITKVEHQLLDAPEASFSYLDFWIKLYNIEIAQSGIAKLTLPKRAEKVNYKPNYALLREWRPNGLPVVSPQWANNKPMILHSAMQFRPPAPPAPNSQDYQMAIKEVLLNGAIESPKRDTDHLVAAAFWANGIGTETPPGRWNLVALEQTQDMPRIQRIKIMLALNYALYDAGIAAWDSKYHYKYWRPTRAIATQFPQHADWQPFMEPPFHPEYVSGHSAFSGAGAAILTYYLGEREFCITSEKLADLTRCFSSFTDAAAEAGQSRIYGGIHFNFSNTAGLKLGRDVGEYILENLPDSLKLSR